MAELAPMFRDPFYYSTEKFGLREGYVTAEGKVYVRADGREDELNVTVRPALGGGYYARAIIAGLVFHEEGYTPGHAAADILIAIAQESEELARRVLMQENAMR